MFIVVKLFSIALRKMYVFKPASSDHGACLELQYNENVCFKDITQHNDFLFGLQKSEKMSKLDTSFSFRSAKEYQK